jgi:bifunctional DNA-binding transcriptional regulator/antitoxin component of YhaV-PrlF toxin-antitoxin module
MVAETKVTEAFQTQVPTEVRARFHVRPGDIAVWDPTDEGELKVWFRKKYTMKDLVAGLPAEGKPASRKFDAVTDKKKAQRGEL